MTPARRCHTTVRAALPVMFGSRRFWRTVDAIAAENRAANRAYKTDEQWERLFTLARDPNIELPVFIVHALVAQKHRNEEARALGRDEAQQWGDERAAQRAEEAAERQQRADRPQQAVTSSRGRKRIA